MASDLAGVERVFRVVIEDGFGKGDLAAVEAVVAPDFVEHQDGLRQGIEGLKQTIGQVRGWFPDIVMTIEDLVVSGDKAWGRMVSHATHSQTVMGCPPTGAPVSITIMDIMRVVDGKMVEHWGVPDQLSMMKQIGKFPAR